MKTLKLKGIFAAVFALAMVFSTALVPVQAHAQDRTGYLLGFQGNGTSVDALVGWSTGGIFSGPDGISFDPSAATSTTSFEALAMSAINDFSSTNGFTISNMVEVPRLQEFSGAYNDLIGKPSVSESKLVSGTVAGGSGAVSIDISSAGFTSVEGVYWYSDDASAVYTFDSRAQSTSTVSSVLKKQTFSGVTVLGINVLGSVSIGNAPNGATVHAIVFGKK